MQKNPFSQSKSSSSSCSDRAIVIKQSRGYRSTRDADDWCDFDRHSAKEKRDREGREGHDPSSNRSAGEKRLNVQRNRSLVSIVALAVCFGEPRLQEIMSLSADGAAASASGHPVNERTGPTGEVRKDQRGPIDAIQLRGKLGAPQPQRLFQHRPTRRKVPIRKRLRCLRGRRSRGSTDCRIARKARRCRGDGPTSIRPPRRTTKRSRSSHPATRPQVLPEPGPSKEASSPGKSLPPAARRGVQKFSDAARAFGGRRCRSSTRNLVATPAKPREDRTTQLHYLRGEKARDRRGLVDELRPSRA